MFYENAASPSQEDQDEKVSDKIVDELEKHQHLTTNYNSADALMVLQEQATQNISIDACIENDAPQPMILNQEPIIVSQADDSFQANPETHHERVLAVEEAHSLEEQLDLNGSKPDQSKGIWQKTKTLLLKKPQNTSLRANKEIFKQNLENGSKPSKKKKKGSKSPNLAQGIMKQLYDKIAAQQRHQILNKFGEQFPEIMALNTFDRSSNRLAIVWSIMLLLIFLYNYFTCLWFMVFPGFPQGYWYACEVAAELISFIDIFVPFIFQRFFEKTWQFMYLLHNDSENVAYTIKEIISSLPTSIILSGALRSRPQKLKHYAVACTRLLKILRYRRFKEYFDHNMLNKYSWLAWFVNMMSIIQNWLLGMHFIFCVFIQPTRFEDGYGWFKLAGYYTYGLTKIPRWQIYIDSAVYCISNMGGMGYGNIVPYANGDWVASCVVLTMGASLYKIFYADFAAFVYDKNQKTMRNHLELEQCNQYAQARHLPDDLQQKINYYFKNLKIPFEEFKQRKTIVQDLPVGLKEEISVVINQNFIKEAKFFKLCSRDLIIKLCTRLKNKIFMINDHVFQKDSAAEHFYFINEGVCQVVASDEQTLIRFMSKGAFFGEIGCLLTGKRSCSVIARTTTILRVIKKDHLIAILEDYPSQYDYLKKIANQRLQTTSQLQIKLKEDHEITLIQNQIKQLENSYTVFGQKKTEDNLLDNLPNLQTEFALNMQNLHGLHFVDTEVSQIVSDQEKFQIDLPKTRNKSSQSPKVITFGIPAVTKAKVSFWKALWHTSELKPDYFILIPWSPLFLIWNFIQAVVVIYNTWMVLFSLFFAFHMNGIFIVFEIVSIILLAADMPMRAKTAVMNPKKFCLDRDKVVNYYLNTWLLLDVVATFPLCYFLMIDPNIEPVYIALVRLPRVLKIFRLNETINMLKWNSNSNIRIEIYILIQLALLFFFSAHLIACGLAAIGKNDYRTNKRFDGQTMFGFAESRIWVKGISDNFSKLTPWGLYQQMFYLAMGICNCCVYGDVIPLTPSEQIFDLAAQIWARVLWAFIGAECVSLVGALYEKVAQQIYKRDQIVSWMKQNKVPKKLIERYKEYQLCSWQNSQGADEQQILKNLPHSLRTEIRSFMFKDMIQNWEALPNQSPGIIDSLIGMLKLEIYPQNEYIITAGEIGSEMYFIVKGVVEIRSVNQELLVTLKQGQNFGQMALIDGSNPVRKAHAVSFSIVQLAVLTKDDFDSICKMFPTFLAEMKRMSKAQMKFKPSMSLQLDRSDKMQLDQSFERPQKENSQAEEDKPTPTIRRLMETSQKIFPKESFHKSDLNSQEQSNKSIIEQDQDISYIRKGSKDQDPLKTKLRKEVTQHFDLLNVFHEQEANQNKEAPFMRVIRPINKGLVFYNLIFIPLQFGYRIKFKKFYLAIEILTLFMYSVEIALRIYKVTRIKKLKSMQLDLIKDSSDRKLFANQYRLQQKIDKEIFQITITLVAVFPFSLILSVNDKYEPFGWLLILQSMRLLKIRPVTKFWELAKKYKLNFATLIQGTFHYYYFAHYFACIMIGIAIHKEDHRTTWLRKLPSPQAGGDRQSPNVFDDLSPLMIYNNAQYYLVNTLSNLSIGDISAVNPTERFLNGFLCFFSTYILNLVYVCNFTIVKYLTTGSHVDYYTNNYGVLAKIDNGKVSQNTIASIRDFYDYMWYNNRGIRLDLLSQNMAPSISADLGSSIYKGAIERSLIFCDKTGEIDMPLVISLFKVMKFKQMLSSQFVVKIGEFTEDTLILLEGQLRVYGLADNQLLGVLTLGSHFGLDLSNDFSERNEILKYDERVRTEFKMDFASDNFDNRSIINIVSSSNVTVGVIKRKDRDLLYSAYPLFKRRMQYINRVLFMLGKKSLEEHTKKGQFENSKFYCQTLQLKNMFSTTQDQYRAIIDQNLESENNKIDLSIFIKQALIGLQREVEHIVQTEAFNKKMLKSDLDALCNFDSEGNEVMKDKGKSICKFHRHTNLIKIRQFMQLVNCVYIAFAIPLQIAFNIPMSAVVVILESISLIISAFSVIVKLRTTIIIKGRSTVRLNDVLKSYWNEGLIIDLIGLLPFNLIFGILYSQEGLKQLRNLLFISFLRVSRVASVWRMSDIIDSLNIYLKSMSYYIILIKAVIIWFIIGHLMACAWFFFSRFVEREYIEKTWVFEQKLLDKNLWGQYLRSYYFMCNVATGVGSGDMVPQNEGERFFITIIMTAGDLLWQFGFGLMIYFFSLNSQRNSKKVVEDKINVIKKLMEMNEDSVQSKLRMEKYFSYLIFQQQNSWLVDKHELIEHLPVSVVREIVIQTNEEIFKVIFKNLKSENLIRELCLALESLFYLPQDYIVKKGDTANEVFIIVDGTVYVYTKNSDKIAITLKAGQYFGEIAVLSGTKREYDHQAATFCLLYSLAKEKIDQIAIVYPQLRQQLEESGKQKLKLIEKQQRQNQTVNVFQGIFNAIKKQNTTDLPCSNSVDAPPQRDAVQLKMLGSSLNRIAPSFQNLADVKTQYSHSSRRVNEEFEESKVASQPRRNSNEQLLELTSEDNRKSVKGRQDPADSQSENMSSQRRLSDCSLSSDSNGEKDLKGRRT